MELTNYLAQIIISLVLFIILCLIGAKLKKFILKRGYSLDLNEFFPQEELLTFRQVHYLVIILLIYFCIMNFFINTLYHPNGELIVINSIIDIILSVYITLNFYDASTKRKIILIFMLPLASISYLLFGGSPIGYWDFIRIPALLYFVVHYYNEFLTHTKKNHMDKLILVLVSIVYFCMIFTLVLEDKNPINAFGMVSNAFTSNSYVASGKTGVSVLVSAFLGWSGYIISGIATATLAAAIILRNVDKKFEKLESEHDNLERIISARKESEIMELKNEIKSIHDENAELKREMAELKDMIKNK
jgi:hypothetical protein